MKISSRWIYGRLSIVYLHSISNRFQNENKKWRWRKVWSAAFSQKFGHLIGFQHSVCNIHKFSLTLRMNESFGATERENLGKLFAKEEEEEEKTFHAWPLIHNPHGFGIRFECFNNKCQIELAEMKMECVSLYSFRAKKKGFIRNFVRFFFLLLLSENFWLGCKRFC